MDDKANDLEELWSLVKRLNDDAKRCLTTLDATPESDVEGRAFWRRMYARAVFVLIDSATYGMTYHAYALRNMPGAAFTPEDLKRLETAYDFDEDREPVATFGKTETLDNIQFAFHCFARAYDSAYVLPIHDQSGVLIKEIFLIKQYLQFCRMPNEIEVHDENVEVLLYGVLWFVECMVELFESCVDSAVEGAVPGELEHSEKIM